MADKKICVVLVIMALFGLYLIDKDNKNTANKFITVSGVIEDIDKNYVSGKRSRACFANALLKYKDGRLITITNFPAELRLHHHTVLIINGYGEIVSIDGKEL